MSSTPPRRFKVEPIETTSKSTKDRPHAQDDPPKPRRIFAPEPIETTSKTHRKFTPEPVETTVKTNRNKNGQQPTGQSVRRFKPEPMETTARSNRDEVRDRPRINVSTSKSKEQEKRPPRKFAPQLIETAKRSRKAGDSTPAILPSDKTEATPGDSWTPRRPHADPAPPPDNTPVVDVHPNPFYLEVNRQASPLSMRRSGSRASTRSHHSFRVPELEPIESSESEESSPASPSTSPSVTSDHSFMYKEATRMRESVDDRFSGYLLDLAAKAAEKQLRDQAMAAFPNDDHHEPVDHYIGRDSDEIESHPSEAKRQRESSFTEVNWELVAMRQYREAAEREKQVENEKRKKREAEMNKPVDQARNPWGNAAALFSSSVRQHKDSELDRMRKGARPPMLGGDIKFPRCPSPEPARFDPTQGSSAIRSAMCYLTEQSQASERGEGLWCGNGEKTSTSNQLSLWCSTPSRPPSRAGLWGGCCVDSGLTPPRGPTGILTPKIELDNPMSPCPTPNIEHLPPTPPASHTDFACIDEKLTAELAIEEEFGDDFVTQVYNYLSLGYPSIARIFDEELARISHTALEELRQDDHLVTARGYIRLGEDGNLKYADITEESCVRWRALRVYIHEWARQQPGMVSGDAPNGGFGIAVRRGSWAI